MAATITIAIPELAKLEAAFKKSPAVVNKQLEMALSKAAILIQRAAIKEAPVDTGNLRSSINIQTMPGHRVIYLAPRAKYAIYVHQGTKPHAVPIKALEKWARRHGVPVGAVWTGIRAHGTKPNPFMTRAAGSSKLEAEAFFKIAMANIIQELK